MSKPFALLLVGLAVGCGGGAPQVSQRNFVAPNGIGAAWITCKRDQSLCYEHAGRICPTGYFILREDGSIVGESTTGSAWGGPNYAGARTETTKKFEGHLAIQCRNVAPASPPPGANAPYQSPYDAQQ